MAEKKPARKAARKSSRTTTAAGKPSRGFTAEERAAMRERARELKAAARMGGTSDEDAVLAKIAAMPAPDRAIGERLHALIGATAPGLAPKLWYGMPAYAREGKVVCYFQNAQKFKTRYSTLGFSDQATLDQGDMWPTAFALKELTAADEGRISELLKRAVR
jgi:uncharacterized protein YdhG (YjbR/CyaY superfamily)